MLLNCKEETQRHILVFLHKRNRENVDIIDEVLNKCAYDRVLSQYLPKRPNPIDSLKCHIIKLTLRTLDQLPSCLAIVQ